MIGSDNAILSIAQAMVTHASTKQAVVTTNIAHADTPGYRAKHVTDFTEMFRTGSVPEARIDYSAAQKPNGNSVVLENQVMQLAEARGQHEMALGLWESTLNMYRTALGR